MSSSLNKKYEGFFVFVFYFCLGNKATLTDFTTVHTPASTALAWL